jgi:hypothetical protein
MKLNHKVILTLLTLSTITCSDLYRKSERTESQLGITNFRVESNSMASSSNKFYANLKNKLKVLPKQPVKIENSEWIGIGYNVFSGNPLVAPKGSRIIDPGFTAAIFSQSYSKHNTTPDQRYLFPDGFEVQAAKICKTDFSSQVLDSSDSLRSSASSSLDVGGSDFLFFAFFTANSDFNDMSSSVQSDKTYISSEASCSVYRVQLNKYDLPNLSDNFKKGFKSLAGKTYSNNKIDYHKFIDTFGTHYLNDITMGSRYTHISEVSKSYVSQASSSGSSITTAASVFAIEGAVGAGGSSTNSQSSSSDFGKAVSNTFKTSIGAPMPTSKNIDDWTQGSSFVPMPISYKLKPMMDLLQNNKFMQAQLMSEHNDFGIDSILQITGELNKAFTSYCSHLKNLKKLKSCEKDIQPVVKKIYEVSNKQTQLNDDGSGSIYYLDRHQLDCGLGSAIKQFNFHRDSGKIQYQYQCIKSSYITETCVTKTTSNNDVAGDDQHSAHYLDRHNLQCDDGYAMRSFKQTRSGNQIGYSFTCCAATFESCTSLTTQQTDQGDRTTFYLDRQNVDAGDRSVFKKIKLNTSNSKFSYDITKCVFAATKKKKFF